MFNMYNNIKQVYKSFGLVDEDLWEIYDEKDTSLQRKSGLKDWKNRTLRLEIAEDSRLMGEGSADGNNGEFEFFDVVTKNLCLGTRLERKKRGYEI